MNLLRAAAALYVVSGAGVAVGTAVTLLHLQRHGELPLTPFGFRSLAGPFESLGREGFTYVGWTLVAVCALDVVAGAWLWQERRRGAWLGLATSPVALILAAGFALPFLLVGVPVRVALVLAGRRRLR